MMEKINNCIDCIQFLVTKDPFAGIKCGISLTGYLRDIVLKLKSSEYDGSSHLSLEQMKKLGLMCSANIPYRKA